MTVRSAVSAEAIARAIMAHIVMERGIEEPSLGLRLNVSPVSPDEEGCNWHVAVDTADADDDIRSLIDRAAAKVSTSLMLNS